MMHLRPIDISHTLIVWLSDCGLVVRKLLHRDFPCIPCFLFPVLFVYLF